MVGLGCEVAGCGTPGGLRASAGSLVDRVGVQEILGPVLTHWWLKPGLGAGAGLTGKQSWVLGSG